MQTRNSKWLPVSSLSKLNIPINFIVRDGIHFHFVILDGRLDAVKQTLITDYNNIYEYTNGALPMLQCKLIGYENSRVLWRYKLRVEKQISL